MRHIFLVLVFAFWASTAAAQERALVQPSLVLPVQAATEQFSVVNAQCDQRWRTVTIGSGTLCRIGCAFFALHRAAEAAGHYYDPLTFLSLLKEENVFDKNSNIIWGKIPRVLPFAASRYHGTVDAREVQENIQSGRLVLLQVGGRHWVFAAEVSGNDIYIDDSRDGARVSLRERYGNKVTGFVTIEQNA